VREEEEEAARGGAGLSEEEEVVEEGGGRDRTRSSLLLFSPSLAFLLSLSSPPFGEHRAFKARHQRVDHALIAAHFLAGKTSVVKDGVFRGEEKKSKECLLEMFSFFSLA